MEKEQPGKDRFNSHYYEGDGAEDKRTVKLHFKEYEDFNRFLNWWVLGVEVSE